MHAHSARESTRFLIVARNYDFDTPEIVHGPITVKGEEMKSRDGAIDGRIPEYIHLLDVISVRTADCREPAARGAAVGSDRGAPCPWTGCRRRGLQAIYAGARS